MEADEAASWSLPITDRGGWCVWPHWPSCRWRDQRAPVIAGSMAEDAAEILHKTCAGDKGANLEERSGGCQTDAPVEFLPEVVVVRKSPLLSAELVTVTYPRISQSVQPFPGFHIETTACTAGDSQSRDLGA